MRRILAAEMGSDAKKASSSSSLRVRRRFLCLVCCGDDNLLLLLVVFNSSGICGACSFLWMLLLRWRAVPEEATLDKEAGAEGVIMAVEICWMCVNLRSDEEEWMKRVRERRSLRSLLLMQFDVGPRTRNPNPGAQGNPLTDRHLQRKGALWGWVPYHHAYHTAFSWKKHRHGVIPHNNHGSCRKGGGKYLGYIYHPSYPTIRGRKLFPMLSALHDLAKAVKEENATASLLLALIDTYTTSFS